MREEIQPKSTTVPNDDISKVETPDEKPEYPHHTNAILKCFKLLTNDKIIFSTQDTSPSDTDYAYQLRFNLEAPSYSTNLIVSKEGNYNIFIERDGRSVKQIGVTIKVGPNSDGDVNACLDYNIITALFFVIVIVNE